MFTICVNQQQITVTKKVQLVSGTVGGYVCQFSFSDDWDGLDKTVVFTNGEQTYASPLIEGDRCAIPWEVLEEPNLIVSVGVRGAKEGTVVRPTLWGELGPIQSGAIPGELSSPPTPHLYDQILAAAEQAQALAQQALQMAGNASGGAAHTWRTLLDLTVEDNSILFYNVDAQGCTEFLVTLSLADDPDITSAVNGAIAVNCGTTSAWGATHRVSDNISGIAYDANTPKGCMVVYHFALMDGQLILFSSRRSSNNHASADNLSSAGGAFVSWTKAHGTPPWYHKLDKIQNVGVGSWTKFFGKGSRIQILGR